MAKTTEKKGSNVVLENDVKDKGPKVGSCGWCGTELALDDAHATYPTADDGVSEYVCDPKCDQEFRNSRGITKVEEVE